MSELDHKEGWVPKNWCFWTVVLAKTLESPLDFKTIKPVNPKGNQSEYSLEGLMLKLKLQYFGQLMQRTDSLEKTLILGKIESKRWTGWQKTKWLDSIIDSIDMNLSKLQETVKGRGIRHAAFHGVPKSQTQLSDWATEKEHAYCMILFAIQSKRLIHSGKEPKKRCLWEQGSLTKKEFSGTTKSSLSWCG